MVLNISGGLHALADGLAGFVELSSTEFFIIDSGDLDVNVDAVEQWTGNSLLIFGHDRGCASAWFL